MKKTINLFNILDLLVKTLFGIFLMGIAVITTALAFAMR